jgi:hypothetical protein
MDKVEIGVFCGADLCLPELPSRASGRKNYTQTNFSNKSKRASWDDFPDLEGLTVLHHAP